MSREPNEEEWKQLFSDVRHNRAEEVEKAIRDIDADLLSTHTFGGGKVTLLYEAARLGHEEVLNLLLDKGVDPNVATSRGSAIGSLPSVATNRDPEIIAQRNRMVKKLLAAGARDEQEESKTDLMRAVEEQNLSKVNELIANGENLDAKDKDGQLVWEYALRANNQEIMTCLINAGINLEEPNKMGHTALIAAVYDENKYKDMAKLLIEKGADVNGKGVGSSIEGRTPLFFTNDAELVDILIKNHADINAEDAKGSTAVWGKSVACLNVLREAGADLSVANSQGENLMMEAALNGDFEKIRFLQEKCGFDINAKDNDGWTPLMYAVVGKQRFFSEKGLLKTEQSSLDCVQQMVQAGAKVSAVTADGTKVEDLVDEKHPEILQYIKEVAMQQKSELMRDLSAQATVSHKLETIKVPQEVVTQKSVEGEKKLPQLQEKKVSSLSIERE